MTVLIFAYTEFNPMSRNTSIQKFEQFLSILDLILLTNKS